MGNEAKQRTKERKKGWKMDGKMLLFPRTLIGFPCRLLFDESLFNFSSYFLLVVVVVLEKSFSQPYAVS